MDGITKQFSELSYDITKKISSIDKKQQGIYFTPLNIIDKSIKIIKNYTISNGLKIVDILEPSCGSCEFIKYIDKNNIFDDVNIDGIEFNTIIYNSISNIKFNNNNINLINKDFLNYNTTKKYDLIIGNPPYFTLDKKKVNKEYYNYFTGRPNIYILFIIKSLQFLETNGILCFALPKNFLNCLYYNKLRNIIIQQYKIISIIECFDDNYIETQQDTILFIIQNNNNLNSNIDYYINLNSNIIFNTEQNIIKINNLLTDSTTLNKLNFEVKVGNIVWNQHKNILTNDNKDTRLIYSSDIKNNQLNLIDYKNKEKKNYISKNGWSDPILVINRGYGSGKYQFNYCLIDNKNYLIENHLIYIKYKSDIKKDKLNELYNKIIESFEDIRTVKFIELYFSNNAINTYELENILPIFI